MPQMSAVGLIALPQKRRILHTVVLSTCGAPSSCQICKCDLVHAWVLRRVDTQCVVPEHPICLTIPFYLTPGWLYRQPLKDATLRGRSVRRGIPAPRRKQQMRFAMAIKRNPARGKKILSGQCRCSFPPSCRCRVPALAHWMRPIAIYLQGLFTM